MSQEPENLEPENQESELSEKEKPILREARNTQESQFTPNIQQPELPENLKDTPQGLTRAQIVQILDNAKDGIAPTLQEIAALANTPYAVMLTNFIRINPQWGINASNYATPDDKTALNRQMREHRKSRLKAIALLPEPPSIEFLQECCTDPTLARDVKNLIARKPCWNFVWDSAIANVDYRF